MNCPGGKTRSDVHMLTEQLGTPLDSITGSTCVDNLGPFSDVIGISALEVYRIVQVLLLPLLFMNAHTDPTPCPIVLFSLRSFLINSSPIYLDTNIPAQSSASQVQVKLLCCGGCIYKEKCENQMYAR